VAGENAQPANVSPVLFDKTGPALFQWIATDIAGLSAQLCEHLQRESPVPSSKNKLLEMFQQDPIGSSIKVVALLLLVFILSQLA